MVNIIDPPDDEGLPPKPENVVKGITETGTSLKKFTIQDVETVLGVLAINGGNKSRTAQQVGAEFGISIHPITIGHWVTTQFPSRYARIQETLSDEINQVVKGRIGDLALRGAELQGRLLERLDTQLDAEEDIPVKELAPSIRNLAQATDVNMKQRQLLENKPTQITEVRTIEQTIIDLEKDEIFVDVEPVEEEVLD